MIHEKTKSVRGITLVEIAIVLVIVGVILVAAFQLFDIYWADKRIRDTKDNLAAAEMQIGHYFNTRQSLPCPSDRALPPGDARYGMMMNYNPAVLPTDAGFGVMLDGACNPAAIPALSNANCGRTVVCCTANNGLCLVPGARDGDDADALPDPVVIGGVPVNSLRLVTGKIFNNGINLDGWGGQLTYAVTLSLTQGSNNYKFFNGAIDGVDEFNEPTAGIVRDGHYTVISHGPDRRGAFTAEGIQTLSCRVLVVTTDPVVDATDGVPGDGFGVDTRQDNENCDNANAKFVQSLGISSATNANYNDDIVRFSAGGASTLWSQNDPTTGGTNDIYNRNARNVGVKTLTPQERLDINGALRVDNNLRARQICWTDPTGAVTDKCFNISAITGSGIIKCPAGRVMDGISEGNATCIAPTYYTPVAPMRPNLTCPAGHWLQSIRTDGCIICTGGSLQC